MIRLEKEGMIKINNKQKINRLLGEVGSPKNERSCLWEGTGE